VLATIFILDISRLLFPHIVLLEMPFKMALPALLWCYIQQVTQSEPLRINSWLVHFLPAFLVLLLLMPFYFLTGIEKLEWFYFRYADLTNMSAIHTWAKFIQPYLYWSFMTLTGVYIVKSAYHLYKYSISIRQEFANTEKITLSWLKYAISTSFIVWLAYLLSDIGIDVFHLSSNMYIINLCVGCGFLIIFSYFGTLQVSIYRGRAMFVNLSDLNSMAVAEVSEVPKRKYKSSDLSNHEVEKLYDSLVNYMKTEKPFLLSDISLSHLAQELAISPRNLSRVINEIGGTNFFDFINRYRVEEAKNRLAGTNTTTILQLAIDVGFNSKSAFYEAFKKQTGSTPTRYKAELEKKTLIS
jgi:AraC-like DNA-binding protein